jgi:hypothetical protein
MLDIFLKCMVGNQMQDLADLHCTQRLLRVMCLSDVMSRKVFDGLGEAGLYGVVAWVLPGNVHDMYFGLGLLWSILWNYITNR